MKPTVALLLLIAGCGAPPSADAVDDALTLCPGGPTVAGIDTSFWQGTIDWAAVAQSGKGFAIARVSDGLLYPDPVFARDWPAIAQAGMVRGAYQFFRPSQDPIAQARLFGNMLAHSGGIGPADLPPILDLEVTDGEPSSVVVARAQAWITEMQRLTGKRPMVYTASFMSSVIGSSLAAYPLWVANYQVSCPHLPTGWTGWRIWQNGDAGRVPGIRNGVDVDVFNGTLDELRAFAANSGNSTGGGDSWSCARSAWNGAQYWTCSGGALHRCSGSVPQSISCPNGCTSRPLGTDDTCN